MNTTTTATAPPSSRDGSTASTDTGCSVYLPFVPDALEPMYNYVRLTQAVGGRRLWIGQPAVLDVATSVAHAAGRGARVPIGLGVSLIPAMPAYAAGLQLRALVAATGHPVTACFSPGDPAVQRMFTGSRYRSPLGTARSYLAAVRGLLSGRPTEVEGPDVAVRARQPGPDVTDRVELGLGVLRPGMARLAGEVADAAVTWLVPPGYLADELIPRMREGAETSRRRVPRVVTSLHACLTGDDAVAFSVAERMLSGHLEAPHYRDLLERSGIVSADAPKQDAITALVRSGVVATGTVGDVAAAVAELHGAGADEVAVVLHSPPGAPAARAVTDWADLAVAVRAETSDVR